MAVIAPPNSSRVEDMVEERCANPSANSSMRSPTRRRRWNARDPFWTRFSRRVWTTIPVHNRHNVGLHYSPFYSPGNRNLRLVDIAMADFRRRSTMQPAADPYGNMRPPGSAIPMPSTVKKSSHSGRMSMSGPAMRAPYPVPNYAPGPTPRAMMRSQNVNPLLMSVSKPSFGKTPQR